jgi:CubicO group peptidase (beta-lactamase class C family)
VGEKWEYSNLGYFALAEIIARASGKPWGQYVQERIFKPLGMTSTRVVDMKAIVPNRASGYAWKENKMENADTLLALRPSGAFLSTVMDMARWDAALYTDKILKQSSRDEMWKPIIQTTRNAADGASQSYGLGWFMAQANGHREIFHGGSQPGFRAYFSRFVDDKLTVVVLTNADNARPEVIARGIAGFYIPDLAIKEKSTVAK